MRNELIFPWRTEEQSISGTTKANSLSKISDPLKLLSALHYTGSKELSAALRSEELTSIARGLTFVLNCWEVISNVFLLLGAVDHPIK